MNFKKTLFNNKTLTPLKYFFNILTQNLFLGEEKISKILVLKLNFKLTELFLRI